MSLSSNSRKRKFASTGFNDESDSQTSHASSSLQPQQCENSHSASGVTPNISQVIRSGLRVERPAQLLPQHSLGAHGKLESPSQYRDITNPTTSSSSSGSMSPNRSMSLPMLSEICYGMITDVLIAPTSLSSPKRLLNKHSDGETSWAVGFKSGTAVLLNEKSEAVGQLSIAHSAILHELKQRIPSLRCEAFLASTDVPGVERSALRKAFQAVVNIYGDKSCRDIAGEELDNKEVFLQEPSFLDKLIPYSNPHVYSIADDGHTLYFAGQHEQVHRNFHDAITSILNEDTVHGQDLDFVQDGRIRTVLEQHQVAAVKFGQSRETASLTKNTPTLWRLIGTSLGLQYRHSLSGFMTSKPCNECRGGLLTDEMGMGKSLSMLSLIVHTLTEADDFATSLHTSSIENADRLTRATLIVTPKSTIESWVNEIDRHLQDIEFVIYHGSSKSRAVSEFERVAIVLTTYETVARAWTSSDNPLALYKWFRIILDEAHHIRNTSTQLFSSVYRLDAQRRWCLTGTPVQNHLNDIFALTTFLRFAPFSTRKDIRTYITGPLGQYDKRGLDNLQAMMRVCSIRRSKQVLELPSIDYQERCVILSEAERKQYESVKADLLKDLVRVARKESKSSTAVTLRGIQKLRQICCYGLQQMDVTDLEVPDEDPFVLKRCNNCATDSNSDSQSRLIQLRCGHRLCDDCSVSLELAPGNVNDSTPIACSLCDQPENSYVFNQDGQTLASQPAASHDQDMASPACISNVSKIDAVICSLKDLHQDRSPVDSNIATTKSLVFSYWIRALNAIEAALRPLSISYVRMDGQTSLEQRQQAIAEFQTNPACRIALMTFGTGSVGLNLTAASYVHLVEPHWNPMVEEQAAARAHRIGQTKAVTIYRYIVQDSIEKNIRNKQKQKLHLASLAGVRDEYDGTLDWGQEPSNDLDTMLEKWHLV